MRNRLIAAAALACLALAAPPASASPNRPGFRVGLTDDPDTIFLGMQLTAGAGRPGLRLIPSIELGFGEIFDVDIFTIRGNGNLAWAFPIGGGRGRYVYPLVGAAVYYVNPDCDGCDDNTEIGINVGVGFDITGITVELMLGLDDEEMPDITLAVAFTL